MFWILALYSLNLVWLLHTLKSLCTIWFVCLWSVFEGDINMFFISQVSGLVENVNIGIYWDTINVINVTLHDGTTIELYLLIPLLVNVTASEGYSFTNEVRKFKLAVYSLKCLSDSVQSLYGCSTHRVNRAYTQCYCFTLAIFSKDIWRSLTQIILAFDFPRTLFQRSFDLCMIIATIVLCLRVTILSLTSFVM